MGANEIPRPISELKPAQAKEKGGEGREGSRWEGDSTISDKNDKQMKNLLTYFRRLVDFVTKGFTRHFYH